MNAKLEWLAREAEFAVTINSVLGVAAKNPEDALTVARRARSLGFHSIVSIAHDGGGPSHALPERQFSIYQEIRRLETGVFSFAHYDRFQENAEIVQAIDDRPYGIRDYTVRDLNGYYLVFGHHLFNAGPPLNIERVDVPVRLEKRLAALLQDLAKTQAHECRWLSGGDAAAY